MFIASVALTLAELFFPPPEDIQRFPTAEMVGRMLDDFRTYQQHAEHCWMLNESFRAEWGEVLREIRMLRRPWDELESFHAFSNLTRHDQMIRLGQLRDLLGFKAYYTAQMPGLPVWRMQRAD